ncbi:MAG: class I SAM-dependent methyltransferase [Rikenellaceae bacterium]|nr:class I SAM-dependent methyltransferase [Rikenellaceae bacterium]MCL2692652.1 class I SAM-dependent methyltransferase [Rikenellaceae bacterium]
MTLEEAEILFSDEVRAAIEANIDDDPLKIVFDKRVPHAAMVATQVKYLQRARKKLPSYYAARCVVPPTGFEQASSERVAQEHAVGHMGALCIDLTCGLGVDSFAFSRRFDKVIAVERNPVTAYVARRNFELLGVHNIEVVNASAEDFLSANEGLRRADLIYIDPDRRDATGRRVAHPSDCSPDVLALMPQLRRTGERVLIKLSPLFDVDEVFRVFGDRTRVEAVSLDGECKEVTVEVGDAVCERVIAARITGFGVIESPASQATETPEIQSDVSSFDYLVIPDVALVKARIAQRYFTGAGLRIESDNSYAFGSILPPCLPGKAYRITAMRPYSPKKLARELRDAGIRRADILQRDFALRNDVIARQLDITEGGPVKIVFTRIGGEQRAIFIAEI